MHSGKVIIGPYSRSDSSRRPGLQHASLCKICESFFLITPFEEFWRQAKQATSTAGAESECYVQGEENGPWIALNRIDCGLCSQLVRLCPDWFKDPRIRYKIIRGGWDGQYPARAYDAQEDGDAVTSTTRSLDTHHEAPKSFDLLAISFLDGESRDTGRETRFTIHALDENAASCILQPDFDFDRTSDKAFQRIHSWIDECQSSHQKCLSPAEVKLPDRVLYIADENDPRLVWTDKQSKGQYAALSYCWGGDQTHKLLKSRVEGYKKQIPISELPATITDAIRVSKKIGLKYLWIDSLCIIQDDEEDRFEQINQMRNIYNFAFATIAVGTASSVTQGFLSRNEPLLWSPRIQLRCPNNSIGQITIYSVNGRETIKYDPLQHALDSRAWTLQERVLSPRVIVYSANTIHWLCNTKEEAYSLYISDSPFGLSSRTPDVLGETETPEKLRTWWAQLVWDYSNRSLTSATDKLPAIAGLADEYSKISGDEYLAGLWKSQLPRDLLWRIEPPGTDRKRKMFGRRIPPPILPHHPRPTEYCAPSWSWASVADRVKFAEFDRSPVTECELLEYRIASLRQSVPLSFGSIVRGELHMRARIRRGTWKPGEITLSDSSDNSTLPNIRVLPDSENEIEEECQVILMGITQAEGLLLLSVGETLKDSKLSKPFFKRAGLVSFSFFGQRSTLPDVWEGEERMDLVII